MSSCSRVQIDLTQVSMNLSQVVLALAPSVMYHGAAKDLAGHILLRAAM